MLSTLYTKIQRYLGLPGARQDLFALFIFVLGVCLSSSAAFAQTSGNSPVKSGEWDITLGAGVMFVPEYEGADELAPLPIPLVDITWRDTVFLNTRNGLGTYLISTDQYRLGVSVGYAPGRDEDDSDRLRGLGDVDHAARGHLFGSYSFGPVRLHADISQDFGGSDGLQIEPGVTYIYPFSKSIQVSAGVSTTWASDDYMQTFFGVSSAQSARSGLSAFDAEAGFKRADLKIGANWNINDHWFSRANLGLGYLLGDAADSPITENEMQPSVGLSVGYKF